jgi:hypothetical protein
MIMIWSDRDLGTILALKMGALPTVRPERAHLGK